MTNTIPTTFRNPGTQYTVLGGSRTVRNPRYPHSVSILLLNRGGRIFKPDIFAVLGKLECSEIISLEAGTESYDKETLARRFPHVRFVLFHEATNIGEQINTGFEEASGRFILLLWSDMKIARSADLAKAVTALSGNEILCSCPLLSNSRSEPVPSMMAPGFYRRSLKIHPFLPEAFDTPSIFPFDYCGLYSRSKFMLTGGYDFNIAAPWWQKLDFGFRSFMWGEHIRYGAWKVAYTRDPAPEDTTPNQSYRLFYLKNLLLRFDKDHARIPSSSFLSYALRSGRSFFKALKEFREVRKWVELNKFRYVQDSVSVTDLWGKD